MACAECQHPDHTPGPCQACAAAGTTCWQGINIAGGDGDRAAEGVIEMATGMEQKPCMMCRHWEGTERGKIERHLLSRGLEARPDGKFVTPIAKDFKGRKSLVLDPKNFGWCRKDSIITDMQATCNEWAPTVTLADFQRRMRR